MATQRYTNRKGARVPGVTTIISNIGWNRESLMRWANSQGLQGHDIRDSRSMAKVAAGVGTAAHDMIEQYLHGRDPEMAPTLVRLTEEDDRLKAQRAFGTFLRWYERTRIVVGATEIWGVDEEYQVGFCPDGMGVRGVEGVVPVEGALEDNLDAIAALFEYKDPPSLIDYKTGKGPFADHFIQVSAYAGLIERRISAHLGRPVKFGESLVLRVAPSGIFHHTEWPREYLDDGWNVFTWARALHTMRWTIEGYVR